MIMCKGERKAEKVVKKTEDVLKKGKGKRKRKPNKEKKEKR